MRFTVPVGGGSVFRFIPSNDIMKLLITVSLASLVANIVAVPSPAAADTNTPTAKPSQIEKQVESLPDLKTVLTNIESKVPEFESSGIPSVVSAPAVWLKSEESASAGFVLQKNPRYPSSKLPRAPRVPLVDLRVTIARYASSGEAQQAVEKSLFERPAMPQPKERYRGALLYRYTSGGTALCQSGQYIVEINPNSEGASPLVMKVLDVVLAELDSTVVDAGIDKTLTKQISAILTECQKIKPGMTRSELLKVFTTEGDLSTVTHRTFVYRGCPYIKVAVEFTLTAPTQNLLEERPTDIISKISKPYLDWSISD